MMKGYALGLLLMMASAPCLAGLDEAQAYYDAGDFVSAFKELTPLADQGDANAQFNLGVMYNNGQGVDQDYQQAIKWYTHAAEQGYAKAQVNLGIMHDNGQGVAQDYQQAVKWFNQAAKQGNAKAQHNLGLMYVSGQGVAQDYQQAIKWYTHAAEQGYAKAQLNLGVMYARGQGVDKNFMVAHILFNLAAITGEDDAIKSRDTAAAMLSSAQLNQAQKLASAWKVGAPLPLSIKTSKSPSKKRK